ncbi:hypothetical protein NsoK4_08840 [Nitrosopumilus sp. K4]|uniref:hypothetical protein n=1 Tax=Nitrosopumilus sp. K4 TaxID=2795383 RepID=UPI001BA6A67C|nr:hypothetical protein [Nitrosopumilus sp. K4]QUC64513.1 hypothetical protein NsoK4_08840 [Nitrosopumilus sp. K4]
MLDLKIIIFGILTLFLISTTGLSTLVFAESIMITKSEKMLDIVFDGKWTTITEWKPTSVNQVNPQTIIRSAHFGNYVYFMIDVLVDETISWQKDKATICFDTKNNKSTNPDKDDYCFTSVLGSSKGVTLQGGHGENVENNFMIIQNHHEFIGVGTMSDENDRYSKKPHASYEFKIPTEVIGRSDNYGFLVFVIDSDRNDPIIWPQEISELNKIPPPTKWGQIVSPDKSLPEFGSSMIIFFIFFIFLIFIVKSDKFSVFYSQLR